VGLFGLVAVATGHEHWLKEREDVLPITGPLNAWIDQLPAKTLKRVEKNLAPALFAVGCAIVVGPDIAVEMRERAKFKSYRQAVSQSPGANQASYAASERATSAANGTVGGARSGGWTSSIPATPPIGFDGDV